MCSRTCQALVLFSWGPKKLAESPQLSQMCGHCFGTYGNAELEAQEHVCQSLVFLALKSSLISPSFSAFLQFRTKNALIPLICILMCSFQKGIWELEQGALTEQWVLSLCDLSFPHSGPFRWMMSQVFNKRNQEKLLGSSVTHLRSEIGQSGSG